jgi:hypothetical protein
MNRSSVILYILAVIFSISCNQKPELTPAEAEEIAREAYIYGFPMVVNYKALYLYTLEEQSPEYKGPLNEVSCDARLFTPEDKAVVSPNSDTPYCMFWMDLRAEPVVLTMPEMEADRYYSFQLIDLYTHNFAYLGTLTTGNGAGTYMIKQGDWKGKVPEGIDQVLECETDLFFVVVRTQLMDPEDLEQVKIIQGEYKVQTLSQFNGQETQDVPEIMEYPVWNEGDQFTEAAFTYLDFMMDLVGPIDEEMEIRRRIARLGIGTKEDFSLESFDDEIQQAIQEGVKKGFHDFEEFIAKFTSDPLVSAKIFGTREFLSESAEVNYQLEDFYLPRAIAAHMGLYGNSGAEAIYPAYILSKEGSPFNAAENNYTLTFEPGQLPPVKAFWSLTMYDGKTQLLIQNPMNRYLLNSDMEDDFVYGDDGSITLYIQKDSPGPELENNWLPAPDGHFYCIMRLYGPEESALTGEWVNPPLVISN